MLGSKPSLLACQHVAIIAILLAFALLPPRKKEALETQCVVLSTTRLGLDQIASHQIEGLLL